MNNILFSISVRKDCWGGSEKWVLIAATALLKKGYKVHILCRKNSIIESKAAAWGIPTISRRNANSLDFWSIIKTYRIIKKLNIDAVFCSKNLDIKLSGAAAKLAHIPVIGRQGLALITDRLKYRILIKYFTDSIMTNTYSIKNEYESYSWFPKNHVKVIYNCVEPETTNVPTEQTEQLKEMYGIRQGQKILLSAGRLCEQKGFHFLIEAARQAQADNKEWAFLVVGDGHLHKKLSEEIQKCKLNNIKLLGFQKNMKQFYALADMFILTSLFEGTPNVVLEAMANKLPVIATNVNGINEIMNDGQNGIVVPSGNASAIYNAINSVIDDPERLQFIADNGYQYVCKNLSFESFSTNFIDYLNEVIQNYKNQKQH